MNHLEFNIQPYFISVCDRRTHLVLISILIGENGVTFGRAWTIVGEVVQNWIIKNP